MARRLDIELTSFRDDGTWTWRAAGAKEPRGAVDAKLLEDGAKVGDVVRVEASFDLDGITIVSVIPSRGRTESKDRIEILAPPSEGAGSVTTELIARRRGSGRDRGDRGDRDEREMSRPRREEKRPRPGRPPRPEGAPESRRRERPASTRPTRSASAPPAADRASSSERRERAAEKPRRTRPPRFVPGTKQRDGYLATLPPEQRAIAEQLARGGMPAIRRAVAEARGKGGHGGEAMISLAEQLLPEVRRAMWLDRAETAVAQLETISLRDLRTTVVGATPRDEQGRAILATLRESLSARVTKIRTAWEEEIGQALETGRVLQALRLSSRAPDPGARLPARLAKPLAEAASAALDVGTPPDRWLALLEAAASSPVRLSVKPTGIPKDEAGVLRQSAAAWAGRIPALAPMLGLALPPPPRPVKRVAPERPRRQERRPPPTGAAPQVTPDREAEAADVAAETEVAPAPDRTADLAQSPPADDAGSAPATDGEFGVNGEFSDVALDDPVVDEPSADAVDEV
jgi:hypothetical protein